MPSPHGYLAALGESLVREEENKTLQARKKARIYRKFEYDELESYREYVGSSRMQLESFEAAKSYFFEHSGVRLGYMQKKFFDEATIALLPKMFGKDLVSNLRYIVERFNIETLNDTVAVVFPRRSGKTEAAAMLIAIIAVSQPNGNCIMYNLTATQAKEFLQSVIKYLDYFKDSEEFGWVEVRRDTRQFIEIRTKKYGTLNSVKSYASALKGNGNIDYEDCESCLDPGWKLVVTLWHTHTHTHSIINDIVNLLTIQ